MKKIIKKIWMTLAILIILLAVSSSIFRSLTPWAKEYKGDVEHHLSLLLGQQVTIQTMETSWYWFQPVLKLNQVTLSDGTKVLFHLNKLQLGINVFKSIWNWQIQPGVLYIDDMHLTFREKKDHWTIDGISTDNLNSDDMTPEKSKQILTWLFQQERLIIKRISAHFYFKDGGIIPVDGLNVSILNDGGHYRLKGHARLEQTNSTDFTLLGDGYFNPDHFDDIEGKFYFSAKNVIPAQWQSLFPGATEHLEGGKGDIKLWVDVHKGSISSIQSEIKLDSLAWRLLNNHHSQIVQSFFANFSWKPDHTGWNLSADHIQLRVGGVNWPDNQFSIKYNAEQGSYQFFVKKIIIQSLLSDAINWPKSLDSLLQMKPQGTLYDTQVLVKDRDNLFVIPPIHPNKLPNTESDFWLKSKEITYILTRFEHLGWNEQPKKQIPGVHNLSGVLNWQPEEGRLELDSENTSVAVSGYPTQNITLLNGNIDWKELSNGLRVSADRFVLSMPDLTLSAQGAVDQVTPKSVGHINLGAEFSAKNIQQWKPFLPKKKLKAKLYTWLTKDLRRIADISGKITLQGMAKDFPFDNHDGVFTIISHASGGDMYINRKWKMIKDVEGNMQLRNRDFNVDIVNADFQGVPVKQMNLRIDDIGHDKENMIINGHIAASLQKMMNYVMASPLQKKLALLKDLSTQGAAQLNLNLQIPLYPENDTVLVKGDLTLADNEVLVNHDLVKFTLKNAKGKLLFDEDGVRDSAMTASALGHPLKIKIQSVKNPKPATAITVNGRWTADSLKSQFKAPVFSALEGSFLVNAVCKFASNPSEADTIQLKSSLKGLAVNLPAPLGKKAEDKVPLEMNVDLRSDNSMKLKANYNDLTFKANQISDKKWSLNMQQKNISADLSYNIAAHELSGHVHRLHLDKMDLSSTSSAEKFSTNIKPDQIPNLNLQVDNLSVGKVHVGDLTLKSKSTPERWALDYCRISSPAYQADIDGEWTQKNAKDKTKLHLKMDISSMSKTLNQWNIHPAVDAKKGYVEFKGGWNNNLLGFSLASVNGGMYIHLKHGIITQLSKETEEKLDLGKLLSILSLQTIPRRLQLDFSDLAHQGYSFDIFQGNFDINKGRMRTQDTYLDGPVAYASMKGDLDLVKKVYDLNLRISPHITASLPIVATIAGGPVAGVATWVATKIINQGMQKISAYSYKVSGPWGAPVVQQLSIVKKKNMAMQEGQGAMKVR